MSPSQTNSDAGNQQRIASTHVRLGDNNILAKLTIGRTVAAIRRTALEGGAARVGVEVR